MDGTPFGVAWYERHPVTVAFDLLGALFRVERDGEAVVARIVEVEAYGGLEDAASHSSLYKEGRRILVGPVGHLYMQFAYGMHTMTNVIAHERGERGAVLLRAAEVIEGADIVERRRGRAANALVGPGNLSQGIGTKMTDLGAPLDGTQAISLVPGPPPDEVHASARIGITKAVAAEWRLFDPSSAQVSRHRRGRAIGPTDVNQLIAQLPSHQHASGDRP